jgi:putative acetyltransferase
MEADKVDGHGGALASASCQGDKRWMEIRSERTGDESAIASLIERAFALAEHSDGTEAEIVGRLRKAGALTVSLAAVEGKEIIGHAAFSPVTIDGRDIRWFGLGPVAVAPQRQRVGVGAKLIEEGLVQLRQMGANGCVVLGEPAYYGRFGFRAEPRLAYPGPPPEYFQALPFGEAMPGGTVAYHPAFG